MGSKLRTVLALTLVWGWLAVPLAHAGGEPSTPGGDEPPARAVERVAARPVRGYGADATRPTTFEERAVAFIENAGQVDPRVSFYLEVPGQTLWLTREGIVLDLLRRREASGPAPADGMPPKGETGRQRTARERLVVVQRLVGASEGATIEGRRLQPGTYNYFLGRESARWRTGVRGYAEVVYRDVWKGINLRLYGNGRDLEQEFVARPGADLGRIRLAYRGAKRLRIDPDGALVIETAFGELRESPPHVYQEIDGARAPVAGRFKLLGDTMYTFEVGPHDPRYALVIDPTLVYSTYLGGTAYDQGNGVAVDRSGNAYVTGRTESTDFPATAGEAVQTELAGSADAFVAKFDSAGVLIYATYLGGGAFDEGTAVAVDGSGNAYVTGHTSSTDFPTTGGGYDTTLGGTTDAFVTKLDAAGSALLYSTYLGGSSEDFAEGIAVDGSSNAYVTGSAFSSDLPTTTGAYRTSKTGIRDVFVTKLNPAAAGSASLVYSTYLGGSQDNLGFAIAVDGAGNAHVTGRTNSTDFPTTAGAYDPTCGTDGACDVTCDASGCTGGGEDVFVTKLNVTGSGLLYSTYLGGSDFEQGNGIAVDAAGKAYVTGDTFSADFPTLNAFQTTRRGPRSAFAATLDPAASGSASLRYSTYLGGTGDFNVGTAVAVDRSGNAYVTGATNSSNFPTVNAVQSRLDPGSCLGGCLDAFVAMLNPAASGAASLVYSTYLGGSGDDHAFGVAVDAAGAAWVTGVTGSSRFPTTSGAIQSTFAGGFGDVFAAKISGRGLSVSKTGPTQPVRLGDDVTYTVTVTNLGPDAATGVTMTDDLPAEVTFLSAAPQGMCSGTTTVTCGLGTLAGNATATITIVARTIAAGQVTNTARVTGNESDPDPEDNTATAVTTVNSTADLAVSMTDAPDPVAIGGDLTYTIMVTNGGPDAATGVTVTDTHTAFVTFVSPSASQGSCQISGFTTVTCDLGTLASGASATVTILIRPSFQAQGQIGNTATVSGPYVEDPAPANNAASVVTTVRRPVYDLAISKADSPDPVPVGGRLTYSIVVTNKGPDRATGVVVADTLPSGLTLDSVTPTQGTCSGTDTIICNLGSIDSQASATVTVVVTPTALGQLTNSAGVIADEPDQDPADNRASAVTTVRVATADLSIRKDASPMPAATVGETLTYTLTVRNNGPDAAPSVRVTDELPAGVAFVSVEASQGSCTGTVSIVCALGTLASGANATVTIVVTPTVQGRIENTARVAANADDPNPGNNSAAAPTDVVLTTASFAQWVATHCPPFVPGPFPPRVVNVAYIPTRFAGSSNVLTMAQVVERALYIRDYFYQQSMCAVVVNPFIVTDPTSADGWLTLPRTFAQYNPGGTTDTAAQLPIVIKIWIDAFKLASLRRLDFLIAQQLKLFDAVFVIETAPRGDLRGRALITSGIARLPQVKALRDALRAGILGTIGAVVGSLGPLALLVPALSNPDALTDLISAPEVFEQGSIVISDRDDNATWAHELGHGIFNWWDYYNQLGDFFNRGGIGRWGLMGECQGPTPPLGGCRMVPPPPVSSFNKVLSGWLGYIDICPTCFGDYPLASLKDLPFGAPVLRYRTPRNLLGHPTGPTAWYVFELRNPPDDVPITRERAGEPLTVPGIAEVGVVMYDKREIQGVLGVATHNPYCGAAHGLPQSALDALIDFDFGSCYWKVDNTATNAFSLRPGGSFFDDRINVTFSLTNDLVLRISGTAKSRTVITMDSRMALALGPGTVIPPTELHVFTPDGRHVGPNAATGQYEIGVADARAGGLNTPVQWISLPDAVDAVYVVDASQAVAAAKAVGLQSLAIEATVSIFRYDPNGAVGKLQDPVRFALNLNQPATGQMPIPLGAPLGPVQDTASPVVTPPAAVSIPATEAAGARVNASPPLAAFLAGASAVDDVDPFPSPLLPRVGGADVQADTLFALGTTPVTFGFRDASGQTGTATAHVTVSLGQPRLSGKITGKGVHAPGVLFVDLQISNTGTGNARNVSLSQVLFRTLAGSGTVAYNAALSGPLPLLLGNLDAGASATRRLFLNVPATVTRFSITENGALLDVVGTNLSYSIGQAVIP